MKTKVMTINNAFKKLGYVKITKDMYQRDDKNGVCLRTVYMKDDVVYFYAKEASFGNGLLLGVMAVSEFLELAA